MDKHRVILSVSIILGALIIGGFWYSSQMNKQESIERQQFNQLQADKAEAEEKAEQTKKEYIAKRKNDCLDIYKTEGAKWNNVRGWRYSENDDQCWISYKEAEPKTKEECNEIYPANSENNYLFFRQNLLCQDGEFENSF